MTDFPAGERKQLAPPVDDSGLVGWARRNLFSSWGNGITTVVLIAFLAWLLTWFLDWAVFRAVWSAPTGQDCRGHGACWALIGEKYRYIFFGSFPYEQHWRPLFAVIVMLAMLILSADRRMWNSRLLWIWGVGSFATFLLMFGQIHIPLALILFAALAVGGSFLHRGPFALIRELARQKKKQLEFIKPSPGYDVDLLCRAGVVTRVRAGIVAMEGNFGLAQAFRKAVERKDTALEEHA